MERAYADRRQLLRPGLEAGVPTTGYNGISSAVPGEVDRYLVWSVPSYANLYKLTGDKHYLDVARVLLHGTKAMLARPDARTI